MPPSSTCIVPLPVRLRCCIVRASASRLPANRNRSYLPRQSFRGKSGSTDGREDRHEASRFGGTQRFVVLYQNPHRYSSDSNRPKANGERSVQGSTMRSRHSSGLLTLLFAVFTRARGFVASCFLPLRQRDRVLPIA